MVTLIAPAPHVLIFAKFKKIQEADGGVPPQVKYDLSMLNFS